MNGVYLTTTTKRFNVNSKMLLFAQDVGSLPTLDLPKCEQGISKMSPLVPRPFLSDPPL